MSERNFYFKAIIDAVLGSQNFSTLISASPTDYNLTAPQAASFATINTALQSANTLASNPGTRTKVTIDARKEALTNMRNSAKLLAKIIYASPAVTDSMLSDLGLLPRASYSPIPFPLSTPIVETTSLGGRMVQVRIHNPGEETSRGKPKGVKGINLYTFVGNIPPDDVTEYKFQGMSTRMISQILFPNSVPSGSTIWIAGCWVGTRGEIGVGSTPISFTLLGGNAAPGKIAA